MTLDLAGRAVIGDDGELVFTYNYSGDSAGDASCAKRTYPALIMQRSAGDQAVHLPLGAPASRR